MFASASTDLAKPKPLRYCPKIQGLTPSPQASVGQPQDQKPEMSPELPPALLAATPEPGFAGSDLTMSVMTQRRFRDTGNNSVYMSCCSSAQNRRGTAEGLYRAKTFHN